jgi:ArsR family transcriptional regulator
MKQTPQSPSVNMLGEDLAVTSLAALAQTQRLRAFRALVVAGPEGLTPGVIAEQLEMAPAPCPFT